MASNLLSRFLVSKSVNGQFHKVSDSGRLFSFDFSLSLADVKRAGGDEATHEMIGRNAQWLLGEPAAQSVDLEGGWRVSLF